MDKQQSNSFSFSIIILFYLFSCNSITDSDHNNIKSISLDSVYNAGITNLVNKNIWLETKLIWSSGKSMWFPNNDTIYVGNITVLFENGDNYIPEHLHGQNRGNMFVTSEYIHKEFNGIEQEYYFRNYKLRNNKKYYLFGYFDYRDWLNVDSTHLANPDFINQSNDVTYWSQTFEFKVSNLF